MRKFLRKITGQQHTYNELGDIKVLLVAILRKMDSLDKKPKHIVENGKLKVDG